MYIKWITIFVRTLKYPEKIINNIFNTQIVKQRNFHYFYSGLKYTLAKI